MVKPGGYKTMTIDEIVTLIQAVSDNGLTSFEYEEGDQKLVLKKKKKKTKKLLRSKHPQSLQNEQLK